MSPPTVGKLKCILGEFFIRHHFVVMWVTVSISAETKDSTAVTAGEDDRVPVL